MSEDKRQSERRLLRTPVRIQLPSKQLVDGRTFDLSIDGLCIELNAPLPNNLTFALGFMLQVGAKPHPIAAQAVARWSLMSHGMFRIGAQFTKISPEHKQLIETWLARKQPAV